MQSRSQSPAPGITPIDTLMDERPQVTCAYLIDADELTLVESGPATSAEPLSAALREAGVGASDLAHVILTHVHLDHAGGAGHLARAFPAATFWIHEAVAKHLADPSRLVTSAARIYGEDGLRRRFGIPDPIPPDRIRGVAGGERLALGRRDLLVMHTPGHAFGHVALQDVASGVVMTGDAVGVHLPGIDTLRPASPPPEFDLDATLASIDLIEEHARGALLFAHFGPTSDVQGICDTARERITRWTEAVRDGVDADLTDEQLETVLRGLADEAEHALAAGDRERFELIGSVRLNAMGMGRYWRKRREGQSSS